MRQLLIITVSQDVNIPRLIVQRQLDFWREHHAELLTTSNKRGSDEDKVLPQDYRSFFSLVSHREALSQKTLHPILVTASVLLRVLQMSGYLGESEEEEGMMADLIIEIFCIMRHNSHAVMESIIHGQAKPLFSNVRSIGVGLYPSLCLLNTSCDQNMTKYYENNKVVGLVSKLIRAGEEVSENYFPSSVCMGREERRAWLQDRFMFHCECHACTADLPTTKKMPNYPVRFVCQSCLSPRLEREAVLCADCGQAFDVEAADSKIKVLVNQILAAANSYKTSNEGNPFSYYQEMRFLYSALTRLVAHPLAFLVCAEQHFLTAVKQVYGSRLITKN